MFCILDWENISRTILFLFYFYRFCALRLKKSFSEVKDTFLEIDQLEEMKKLKNFGLSQSLLKTVLLL
jgi:hypothetical protein